jgi:Skp family chaperone for outer membrane proteins
MKKLGFVLALVVTLSACQSAYYAAWEKVGVEKRDILVDRVENAKESQEDAQEEFASALEELSALIEFDGGELQSVYENLSDQLESSESAAADVTTRIDKVESVAQALFDEWAEEIEAFSNAKYKRESNKKLKQTQRQYEDLMRSMRKVERSMEPVLVTLRDNVLYLKHNLNANAIGALRGELSTIQKDVDSLIKEMNTAIQESNAFIESMKAG